MENYFKTVRVEDELPEKSGRYFIFAEGGEEEFGATVYFNGKRFEVAEWTKVTSWLKPLSVVDEILLRTPTETKQAVSKYADQLVDAIGFAEWASGNGWTFDRSTDTWKRFELYNDNRRLTTPDLLTMYLNEKQKG